MTLTVAVDEKRDGKGFRKLSLRRFGVRLVAGMLVVSVPIMVCLAVLLTSSSSTSLTSASHRTTKGLAHAIALRLEDWIVERRASLRLLSAHAREDGISSPDVADLLDTVDTSSDEFSSMEVLDPTGEVLLSSGPAQIDASAQEWFVTLSTGQPVLTSPTIHDGHLVWVMAEPVLDHGGDIAGSVIGYLDVAALPRLLNAGLNASTNVLVVDPTGTLIYDTEMGYVADDAALLEAGGLATTVDNPAIRGARSGGDTVARYRDPDGRDVIGGSDLVDGLDWTLLAQEDTAHSLAPVRHQRWLALMFVLAGLGVAIVFALWFARWTTRPLRRLTEVARRAESGDLSARVEPSGSIELVDLGRALNGSLASLQTLVEQLTTAGVAVNSAASELSASSDELAATTTQQSAAVTQASATTEELARASSAIAETVNEVARQTAETRDNLEHAEHDIQLSSERTVALAKRVNDIGGLLELINEIADQTGLLALNAAIEAARAGEDGRGFAVVAEEVRRLADNSKSSAGDIARIIEGVHAETNATVMAMEKGAKQMQHSLALLEHVTEATDQVRLTTQQQRSATAQVVETMEQLTDASRQVSITAQQIAGAAGNLADLAGTLDASSDLVGSGSRQ